MSWVNWYLLAWNRTFEINGRSRRKEFGYFFLVTALLALVLLGVGVAFGPNEALTTARIRVSMGLYLAVVIVPKSTVGGFSCSALFLSLDWFSICFVY